MRLNGFVNNKDDHYELMRKFNRLEKYLGVEEVRTNTIEYVKKGGPEKGKEKKE